MQIIEGQISTDESRENTGPIDPPPQREGDLLNIPENTSDLLDETNTQEREYEFVESNSTMEGSIQHFFQYQQHFYKLIQEYEHTQPVDRSSVLYDTEYPEQQRIPELKGHPLLSEYKYLMTSIFYNPKYPDQIIYLQKNRDNSESRMDRSIEAWIEKQGFRILNEESFGESSVARFMSGIDSREFYGGNQQYQHNNEDDNLSISTFCNPSHPDQIVHLQQTQNDNQQPEDHSKPNIPMLLKKSGFIKLKTKKEIESSIYNENKISSGNIASSSGFSGTGKEVYRDANKDTLPFEQKSCPDLSARNSSSNVGSAVYMLQTQVSSQHQEEDKVKPSVLTASQEDKVKPSALTASQEDNITKSKTEREIAHSTFDDGMRRRKPPTFVAESPSPKGRRASPLKQYMNPKGFGILLVVVALLMYRIISRKLHEHGPTHPYEKNSIDGITDSTKNLVNGMGNIDLPPSDSIMKGTVLYKQFANVIENSPAFRSNGATIAEYLRQFSKKIFDAGIAFEAMYRKGDMLFWVLETQINLILDKLNPSLFSQIFSKDDASYISARLEEINREIVSFERKIKKAMDAMEDADNTRDSAERVLIAGQDEAERFVDSRSKDKADDLKLKIKAEAPSGSRVKKESKFVDRGSKPGKYRLTRISDFLDANSGNDRDSENARKHLEQAGEILNLLRQTAEGLDEIQKLLTNYRYSLEEAKAEVKDKTFVTKEEIEKLRKLLDDVHRYHKKFIKKSEPMAVDESFY